MLNKLEELNLHMEKFQSIPMHGMFLEVMKALIPFTGWILFKKKSSENKMWNELVSSMQKHKKLLANVTLTGAF